MMSLFRIAICVAAAAPAALMAQSGEADGQVDLDAIDALLGDQLVTGDEDMDGDAAAEDAAIAADDSVAADEESAEEGDGAADDDGMSDEDEAAEEEGEPAPSDLTVAFNAYSLCSSEAGAALEEQGFAIDQIGEESLLRCSGQRAAYVNAFYFSLLPRYPDAPEPEVRGRAERLVAQSDAALINLVTAEVRELRNDRPAEAAEEEPQEELPEDDVASDDEADVAAAERADAPPMNLQWFDGEEEAAALMEAHIICLSGAADERRADTRPVEEVADEIVALCADEGAALTRALTDIFQRNPDYLPEGADPEWAAESAIASASQNVERLVAAQRNQD